MSDYLKVLPVPHALLYYNATIETICCADDIEIKSMSGIGPHIEVKKDLPCKPMVLVQAYDLGYQKNGPCWYFDYEADQGRGVWVIYDEAIHKAPQSMPVVEKEEDSATLSDVEPERPSFIADEYDDKEDSPTDAETPHFSDSSDWVVKPSDIDEDEEFPEGVAE